STCARASTASHVSSPWARRTNSSSRLKTTPFTTSAFEVVGNLRELTHSARRDGVDGRRRGARIVPLALPFAENERPELGAVGLEHRHLERGRVEAPARRRIRPIGRDLVPLEPAQQIEEVVDLGRPRGALRRLDELPLAVAAPLDNGRLPSGLDAQALDVLRL